MLKNLGLKIVFVLILLASLSACSASAAGSSQTGAAVQTPQPGMNRDTAQLTLESRLAVGILKLEESSSAITPQQAQALLPIWKAVKSLSSSETASAEEIQALYEQIQESLTEEQILQIQTMSLTQDDLSALMEKYGIQPNLPAGGGTNLTQEQMATRVAQRAQSGGFAGGGPGGGFPPDGGAGGAPPSGFTGQPGQQITPNPTRMAERRGVGMNHLFLDPLIQLLESRAVEA